MNEAKLSQKCCTYYVVYCCAILVYYNTTWKDDSRDISRVSSFFLYTFDWGWQSRRTFVLLTRTCIFIYFFCIIMLLIYLDAVANAINITWIMCLVNSNTFWRVIKKNINGRITALWISNASNKVRIKKMTRVKTDSGSSIWMIDTNTSEHTPIGEYLFCWTYWSRILKT